MKLIIEFNTEDEKESLIAQHGSENLIAISYGIDKKEIIFDFSNVTVEQKVADLEQRQTDTENAMLELMTAVMMG